MRSARPLDRLTARLGVPGIIGIGMLFFAAMYFVSAGLPARDRAVELRQEIRTAERLGRPEASRGGDLESDLATFYTFFAASRSVPAALQKVDAAVSSSGLAFEAAQYRLSREGGLRLARYEVTLPLRGTYGQVRSFVAALLDEMPQAAIDDVVIKRESADATVIEARLRLSIYLNLP